MKITFLCICLATSISAAPLKSSFSYLPQYGVPWQSGSPHQQNEAYPAGQPQPGLNGPVSLEIVLPPGGQVNGQLQAIFNYLSQHGGPKQSGQPTQEFEAHYPAGQPQLGLNGPVSMELVFPQGFPGNGQMNGQSYLSQAYIKYSIPKAPGRKSVEIYYPYDFVEQKLFPPQTPPQTPNIPFPPYNSQIPHHQDPIEPAQQEQPAQTGQVPHVQP